jgi:SAM-dependent methyltransferase
MSIDLQLQTNNKTFLGRHWTEHNVLRRYFANDQDLSILSFGCSTGEELASLRLLFPKARLYGCDIDWYNLQAARALMNDKATIFTSSEKDVAGHGPYDIILCNSVLLTHTTVINGRKRGIDPALWNSVVAHLDSVLKPGGILQIICSNIPFRSHATAANYVPLRSPLLFTPNHTDVFSLDGKHLCSGVGGVAWSSILHRHWGEEAWREMLPTDLHDIHFYKRGGKAPLPIQDEVIPNLQENGRWASGTTSYRPEITPDPRPSTHMEVDTTWTAVAVDAVRLDRTVRRIWFDGSVALTWKTAIDMTGPTATAYIEAAIGRRSTRLATDALFSRESIQSPSF